MPGRCSAPSPLASAPMLSQDPCRGPLICGFPYKDIIIKPERFPRSEMRKVTRSCRHRCRPTEPRSVVQVFYLLPPDICPCLEIISLRKTRHKNDFAKRPRKDKQRCQDVLRLSIYPSGVGLARINEATHAPDPLATSRGNEAPCDGNFSGEALGSEEKWWW